jgi:hypothetical protein
MKNARLKTVKTYQVSVYGIHGVLTIPVTTARGKQAARAEGLKTAMEGVRMQSGGPKLFMREAPALFLAVLEADCAMGGKPR